MADDALEELVEAADEIDVDAEVDGDDEEAVFGYDDESPNIVAELKATKEGRDVLSDVADQVIEDFDEAYTGSEEYREKVADNYKLYSGFLPSKPHPFQDCSNAHIPLYLENVSRLEARAYSEIFLTGDSLFTAVPVGPGEAASIEAAIVTKHTNWQLAEQIPDFNRQMQRAVHLFFNQGDFTVESYYDEVLRQNRHETLSVDDVYVPYVHVSTMPDFSDVPYIVKVLRYRRAKMLAMKGQWEDVDDVLDGLTPDYESEPESKLRRSIAETEGEDTPDSKSDRNAEWKLLQYDGDFQFPGEETMRPIRAVVDEGTKTVLRLFIRETVDWQDQIRFDREAAEKEQYLAGRQEFQQASMEYPDAVARYEQYLTERDQMGVLMEAPDMGPQGQEKQALELAMQADDPGPPQPPQEPIPPGWLEIRVDEETGEETMSDPELPRKVPINMYSHVICMENTLGTRGLSPGQMYADGNRAVNNMFNQFSDQATLANTGTYIASDLVDFEAGDFEIGPGLINRMTGVSPSEVKNAITDIRPGAANPQLIEGVKMLMDWMQSAFGATAALSGESGKSGETFRGYSERVQQALKQLSVSGKKLSLGVEQVGKNNSKLNAMHLADDELVYIAADLVGQPGEEIRPTRKMYQQNYKIQIKADMRFTSQQQRISEADQMVAMPQSIMPLQGNLAWWHASAEQAVKARGQHNMLPMLGPAPPPPQTPLGVPPPPTPEQQAQQAAQAAAQGGNNAAQPPGQATPAKPAPPPTPTDGATPGPKPQ